MKWISFIILACLVVFIFPIYTGLFTVTIPEEQGPPIQVLFCPQENCGSALVQYIEDADDIDCAFFDLDLKEVVDALERKGARVVIDGNNKNEETEKLHNIKYDTKGQLSHNKFCVFDHKIVWTGSFNPTVNGDTKNNNNVVIIHSKLLAQNYADEFTELWNRKFGRGNPVPNPQIEYNHKRVENYFCPEDDCQGKLLYLLDSASSSIHFMTFSFTDDFIGKKILKKSTSIEVHGIFEKRQNSKYTEYTKLKDAGLDVSWDTNPHMMHHKVFIIDKKIVVTGSYNPTKSGTDKNDENILVIHDTEIAQKFLEEFIQVYKGAE